MITYQKLSQRPACFQRLTGTALEEFDQVYDKFYSCWQFHLEGLYPFHLRERTYGGGGPSRLKTLKDKLVFILVYTRIYPLLVIHGSMFNLSEGRACFWVHRLLPLLDQALGYAHQRPVRGRGKSLDQVLEEFPELKELGILGDGVDRPVRRPQDSKKQKACYSGKRKRHTKKNVVLSHPRTDRIVYLGQTQDGSVHDKQCLDEEQLHCRDPVVLGLDLGFEGFKADNIKTVIPTKKPRGKPLTETQKQQNQAFAKIRVRVEHALSGVKRNRSVADIYRNIKPGVDDALISIACGLHNLRVAHRYI
jgi:hypothetical protein